MAICKICGQEKAHAFIFAAGVPICTEDAMRIVEVVQSLGLDEMKERLKEHQTVAVVANNGGS